MQEALALMAAHAVLSAAAPTAHHQSLLFPNISSPSSNSPPLHYSVAVKENVQPFLSLSAAAAPKTLTVSAKKAVAVLKGPSSVEGVVTLTQDGDGPTTVNVRVTGLTSGKHGFHLHEYGDTTKGCISTGAHFNPNKLNHGAPEDDVRHAGDLGNIVANSDGVAEATIVDTQIPLSGSNSVVGRAFVVHELEDDLGKGSQELSLSTGNAGSRLACGVVGLTPL